ncbi:hypothetical protein [Methylococcus sp. EFPC2]|uniref:hypothetical protein n=1 Tax=Methylococcus sp. EFPC2 TaxID=2812648 RepID=UPI00196804BA|nr:hypothetical protein [Methylococcus sp. EFPC2]QSA98830.1 hypothetical protein JWZ97_08650 [Methylococcus sp. EFPC2]
MTAIAQSLASAMIVQEIRQPEARMAQLREGQAQVATIDDTSIDGQRIRALLRDGMRNVKALLQGDGPARGGP